MTDPIVLEARDDRTETYLRTIREHLNPNIQMVVIIFPTSRDDRYAAVKKLCCVECPVPSQVLRRQLHNLTMSDKLLQPCTLYVTLYKLITVV